jgi:hypothetical protein
VNWIEFYERELKPRLSPESVFGELRGARAFGGKLRAPCPLHQGHGRNFVIDPQTCCWFCHSQCNEGGGPIEFVHRVLGATGEPRGTAFVNAVKELAQRCRLAIPGDAIDIPDLPAEADLVWNEARPVTTDAAVSRWLLADRKLDPDCIAASDLARVLSPCAHLPRWAGFKRSKDWCSWPAAGYRVIVPLVNAHGRVASLRFRKPTPGTQGRSATGASGIGVIMADPIARALLASQRIPDFWSSSEFTILIAEGEPDFWCWATEPARRGLGFCATSFPAVLGVVSGSFDLSIASRLPVGTHIISAMDRDQGGDKLHERIARVVADINRGFSLSRWSPR